VFPARYELDLYNLDETQTSEDEEGLESKGSRQIGTVEVCHVSLDLHIETQTTEPLCALFLVFSSAL
jgi:hypothetical protein